jgi:hypothetical protein
VNRKTLFTVRHRTSILLLGSLLQLSYTSSSFASSGTEGAAFLDVPVGGRPAALGGAYSALAYDAYAPVHNPAGLGFLERTEFSGMHLTYLEDMNYEFASFTHPVTIGHSIGASIQYFRPGDIDGLNDSGNPTGSFSGSYAAYSLAYGQEISERLALGVATKVIRAAIADYSSHAYGVDVGSLYQLSDHLMVAGGVANLGTRLKFINDSDPLPLAYRLGASYFPWKFVHLAAQGEYSQSDLLTGRFGVEWHPVTLFSLRAGYKTDTIKELSALAGLTTGVGVHLWGQELDYAWVPLGDLGTTHYFSAVFRFGEAERAKRNLIRYARRRPGPERQEKDGFWSVYNFDEHELPPEGTLIASPPDQTAPVEINQ